jgi:hypothetical protein
MIDSALYPGLYDTMSLTVKVPTSAPSSLTMSLIFRDSKVFVPPVRNSVVHLAPVTLDSTMVNPSKLPAASPW